MKKADPRRYAIVTHLGQSRLALLRKLWLQVRKLVLPTAPYQPIFRQYQPDLLVVGTAGLNQEEYCLLRCAAQQRVRTLCALQSWDLLTTKGDVMEAPQKMLVWNDGNVREVTGLFGYPRDDVKALGVPHFDLYFKPDELLSREEWLATYGLKPDRKVLLVTPAALHIHRNLPEVVQTLVDGMNNNAFVTGVQVLIRPHPQVYMGVAQGHGTEADLVYYESLHPLVKGNRPEKAADKLLDNTAISEMRVLANNLYHADVVIDFYGTVSIEAAMVDTPIVYADVSSSFAATGEPANARRDGIDYREFAHLKNVFRLQGARTAYNRQELYDLVNLYLQNPGLDRTGRRKVSEAFCQQLDGHSAERVALTIRDYAEGHWSPDTAAVADPRSIDPVLVDS